MRLIDGDALIIDLLDRGIEGVQTDDYAEFQQIVEDAPTVDAVPVVFCRDCKLHDNCYTEDVFKFARLNNDRRFCGVGKRKGGDE